MTNLSAKYRIRRGDIRLQVLVTQRCNAVCEHCDKAVGMAKMPDIEMTTARMKQFVDQMIKENMKFARVSLSGGEPVVNKELQGIINESARIPGMRMCRVLSNDLNATWEKRSRIKFPDDRFAWYLSPLDDSDNPKSGKNKKGKRWRDRIHQPYWISPDDIGMQADYEKCDIKKFCGRGLDSNGFSMCGQAPIIGRILGIDPYPQEAGEIKDHIFKPIPEICKHCLYGLTRSEIKEVRKAVARGEVPDRSQTYVEAFGDGKKLVELTL